MKYRILLLSALVLMSCKKDSLTGPELELVGTWVLSSYTIGDLEIPSRAGVRYRLRLKADGTWEDNEGGVGEWSVSGNRITSTGGRNGKTETLSYFLEGRELALIYTREQFLASYEDVLSDEDMQSLRALLNEALGANAVIRTIFERG